LSLFQVLRSTDKESKLDIKIYESSNQVSDIGAGILFSQRALQILREAGLGDQIAAILPEDVDRLSKVLFDFHRVYIIQFDSY